MARLDFRKAEARALVAGVAARYELPVLTVAAQVMAESGGDPLATRQEDAFRWVVNAETGLPFRRLTAEEATMPWPPLDFPGGQSEWTGQRTSWGLLQVMGALARELHLTGSFSGLFDPEVGLDYGLRHLARLRARYGDMDLALAAYNTGRPLPDHPYTARVRAWERILAGQWA